MATPIQLAHKADKLAYTCGNRFMNDAKNWHQVTGAYDPYNYIGSYMLPRDINGTCTYRNTRRLFRIKFHGLREV